MRVASFVMILIGLYLPSAFSQSKTYESAPSEADERKLRHTEESLLKAENENNKDLLASLLASDFQTLTPDGRTFGRSQILEETSQRATMHFPYRVQHSDQHIFLFGDTAVVAYTKLYEGTEGEIAGKIRKQNFVDVFTKEASGWKLRFAKAEIGAEAP